MIAIVNLSTLVSAAAALAMVDACDSQVVTQFAPAWSRLPAVPQLMALEAVPHGVPVLAITDDSDDASALGYHTETSDGRVIGIIAARPVLDAGGDMLTGSLSVSSVLSHEILETHLNPWVDMWCDMPDGRQIAFEACDPCQGDSYSIGGVSVSNFVCSHFFDGMAESGSKFDWLGKIAAPFELSPGGYAVVRSRTGVVSQIGAAKPAWKAPGRVSRMLARA